MIITIIIIIIIIVIMIILMITTTTTTVSFICMTITIQHCKSVENMIITVIWLSGYNFNIEIITFFQYSNKRQINLSLISKYDEMNIIKRGVNI